MHIFRHEQSMITIILLINFYIFEMDKIIILIYDVKVQNYKIFKVSLFNFHTKFLISLYFIF